MAARQSQMDTVRTYIELINEEGNKIKASLDAIAEYAAKLQAASVEAQQRLIGRS